MRAEIGIIGGTGVYDPKHLLDAKKVEMSTPYGEPSDDIVVGKLGGRKVAFVNRHGPGHKIPPHMVNYRASIWALSELGVTRVLAPTAVGSLADEYRPGDFVVPDQFIDRTHGRVSTFYEKGQVCHISVADPFCAELRGLLIETCRKLGYALHDRGTQVCINGPRFSTKAESLMFQKWGAHTINMTLVPECVLAREMEMCYASIAMVTDYDCWKEHNVTFDEVIERMKENEEKVKKLLLKTIEVIPKERGCGCGSALGGALI